MKISVYRLRRTIASCLVMLVSVPLGEAATVRPQPAIPGQQAGAAQPAHAEPQAPDSTGNKSAIDNAPQSQASPDAPNSTPAEDRNPGTLQSRPEQQQNTPANPVGTATAPYEKTTGVAASRPAGAVIAPAKQKRTRSFLIRIGVLVGACIAVGTVVGLSQTSPSHPN
jgi:hypothetical protein